MSRIKSSKKTFLILRLGFLAGSIYILLLIVDLELVFSHLMEMPFYTLAVLILLNLFRSWLHGLRWQLLNPDLSEQLNMWQYFRLIMIAHSFNLIMPGALGGDLARTGMTLKKVKKKRAENVVAILADRLVGLISILFLGSTAFLITTDIPDRTVFYSFFAVIYLAIAVIFIILTNSSLHKLLSKHLHRLGRVGTWFNQAIIVWSNALKYFCNNSRKVALSLLLCLPIHGLSFFSAYLLARSLSIQISFFDISLIISLMWLVTAIPITISGAGVRELSLIYLFSIYGVAAEPATALSLYIYIISLLIGLFGLFFIIDWGKIFQPQLS